MVYGVKRSVNEFLGLFDLHLCKRSTFARLSDQQSRFAAGGNSDAGNGSHQDDTNHSPLGNFNHLETLRLTKRRQEHLASLGLNIARRTVLEVGAGIGDHTTFFLDRECTVLSTEARPTNLAAFRERYERYGWYQKRQHLEIAELDLDNPPAYLGRQFDIVYCYGVLYHLEKPGAAIEFMSRHCSSLLLLETSVSFGWDEHVVEAPENSDIVSQSIHGRGCHPTRRWVFSRLQEQFEHVYLPKTQPWHEQFPIDWLNYVPTPGIAQRAVFVASRQKLDNPLLADFIPEQQRRV